MNGVGAKVDRVLMGIRTARLHGLPVKVNAVIQRGVNEAEVLPLVRMARQEGVVMRFIEYMDVGETNGWDMKDVVSMAEILETIREEFPLEPVAPKDPGEVAKRFRLADGSAEIGIISSVTQPFCGGCQRLRLSADGKLFTCLFAAEGQDVKNMLRTEPDHAVLRGMVEADRALADRPRDLNQSNKRFHRQMHRASHNRYLDQMLQGMRRSLALLSTTTLAVPGRGAASVAEHDAIIRAIEARDEDGAEAAARLHISNAFVSRLKIIAEG